MSRAIHLLRTTAVVQTLPHRDDPDEIELFATELQRYTAASVSVREDLPTSIDTGSWIIISDVVPDWMLELSAREREDVLARTFLLQAPRAPGILQALESQRLAGAIDTMGVTAWRSGRGNGYGIAGLRAVIERVGGKAAGGSFASEHYAIYSSPTASNLPQALIEYLDTLAAMRDAGEPGV